MMQIRDGKEEQEEGRSVGRGKRRKQVKKQKMMKLRKREEGDEEKKIDW